MVVIGGKIRKNVEENRCSGNDMKAAHYESFRGPVVITDIPDPSLGADHDHAHPTCTQITDQLRIGREHMRIILSWTEYDVDAPRRTVMTSRSYLAPLFVFGLVIWAAPVSAAPEAPWLSERTVPRWADVEHRRALQVEHDADKTDEENGATLAQAVQRLKSGDMLKIGPGRYSIARKFEVDLQGTAKAPIWIVGTASDRLPIITRPDSRQNVMNVGQRSGTEYVCFRHLEFTGGSTLIRFYDCHYLWLDQCRLHHAGGEGITTNTRDTSHLFITRNHFHDFTNPSATGEAMYLGANHGKVVMSYSVIAGNHVHHCGGTQGDGIEVKQGSHHNWIHHNHVHDTKYPCILTYGTGGKGLNVIEQNICYRSNDNVLQVQGEAIVRNNLLIAAQGSGFASTDHQGKTTRLAFVHNTIISRRRGANLSSWNGRDGMLFSNNVIYTDRGDALRFPRGAKRVIVSGNVVVGQVSGVTEGFVVGNGLHDFADVSWDGRKRAATLSQKCPFIGAADKRYTVKVDITGSRRGGRPTAGAFDAPSLHVHNLEGDSHVWSHGL
jgi:hypothetical protein